MFNYLIQYDVNTYPQSRSSFKDRIKKKYLEQGLVSKFKFYDQMMFSLPNDHVKKMFNKRNFLALKVIGQFNKGFIVCTLNDTDLFILD